MRFLFRRQLTALAAAALLLATGCATTDADPAPAAAPTPSPTTATPATGPATGPSTGPTSADPSPVTTWHRPRYRFATKPKLTRADIHSSALAVYGVETVTDVYRDYGTWLVKNSVKESTATRNAPDLGRRDLTAVADRMAPDAAADWRTAVAQPVKHRDSLHALLYFGFPEATPFRGGPVVVNTSLRNPGFYATTNGKLKFVAVVEAELRDTDDDGRPVRWPITRSHTLFLVPSGSGWLIDGWQTRWDYDTPAIPDA